MIHLPKLAAHPTRLLLFTQNTTRNPISWNAQLKKPNPNEALHAVHLALHRALDPCIGAGSSDTCSWTVADVVVEEQSGEKRLRTSQEFGCGDSVLAGGLCSAYESGSVTPLRITDIPLTDRDSTKDTDEIGCGDSLVAGGHCNDDIGATTPLEKTVTSSGVRTLIIPRPVHLKPSPMSLSHPPEVSVKLSLYGNEPRDWIKDIKEALARFETATGVKEIDRFILGLPGVKWEGCDAPSATAGMKEVDELIKSGIWNYISSNSALHSIGVADFSYEHLNHLLSELKATDNAKLRLPQVDQLNIDTECDPLSAVLSDLAKRENVDVLSHSDDRVPADGVRVLLNEFKDRLPVSPDVLRQREDGREGVSIRWVLKYTMFLKDRGLVADKGFIISAQFLE